ncbi:MAG: hypothetical protein AAB600_05595 [Patescibacteria group bacterium]
MDIVQTIKDIQALRNSKVICYFMADRESIPNNLPGFVGVISSDSYLHIRKHLKKLVADSKKDKLDKLDLILYTRGGEIDAVMPLINLLRSYSKEFNIMVPFKAHSAGTLACLGADSIIMTRISQLSPIDPTTANQFNPLLKNNDPNSPRVGISVEDVASYFKFAFKKEEDALEKARILEIKDESAKVEVFKELVKHVHPLALGNVFRIYSQIRLIGKELLEKHLSIKNPKIKSITKALAEDYYSHQQTIDLEAAKEIFGTLVKVATPDEEKLLDQLLDEYVRDMELDKKFNLRELMGDDLEKNVTVKGAYIHSEAIIHIFETKLKITQRSELPPNVNIQVPPGGSVPLISNFPRAMNVDVVSFNWKEL